jgi:hypothetical protein
MSTQLLGESNFNIRVQFVAGRKARRMHYAMQLTPAD